MPRRGITGTPGHAAAVGDGTVDDALLAGAALAPGTPGDASASPPWLSELHASLQKQLADSLAASQAAAQAKLAEQAAQQQRTLEELVAQLTTKHAAAQKAVDAGSSSANADLDDLRAQLREQGLALQALRGAAAGSTVNDASPTHEHGGDAASVAGSSASGASTVQNIETVLATALGEQDPSLQWDASVSYFSTELWRITQALVRDKKLDTSECFQLNTIVGAARMLLHLRATHSAAMSDDDLGALDDILERCSRDVCRVHLRFDPLVKSKDDAEKIFSAAVAKRDKDTSIGALGGVPVTIPEVQEILARMRRDQAEKVFAKPEERRRQDRKDFEEGSEKQDKSATSSAKQRDLQADRKRQAQKITELTKFIKAQGLEPPKKDAGAAGGRGKGKAAAADSAAAP